MKRSNTKVEAARIFMDWRRRDFPMTVDALTAFNLTGIEIDSPTINLSTLAMKFAVNNRRNK